MVRCGLLLCSRLYPLLGVGPVRVAIEAIAVTGTATGIEVGMEEIIGIVLVAATRRAVLVAPLLLLDPVAGLVMMTRSH